MNKESLTRSVASETGMTLKDSAKVIDAFVECVKEGLVTDGVVKIVGFGAWEKRARAERVGVNPQTHAKITIPAKSTVGFKASKNLKEAVNVEVTE